jgi:hypothetical protein
VACEEKIHGGERFCAGSFGTEEANVSAQRALCDAVVCTICILLRVVDKRAIVGENVRAAHELQAQCESVFLRLGQMMCDVGGCRFEICLVSIVNDGLPVGIELAHEFETCASDSVLEMLRFGVDDDLDATLFARYGDFVKGVEELLWWEFALCKCFDNSGTSSCGSVYALIRACRWRKCVTHLIASISPSEIRAAVLSVPTRQVSISVSLAWISRTFSAVLLKSSDRLEVVSKTVSLAYVKITPLNPKSFNCCTHLRVSPSVSPAQNWLYSIRFNRAFKTRLWLTSKSKLRFGFAKKDKSRREGSKRSLFDDTVAMKSDRSSMCVGMTDNGCSASFCFTALVFSLFSYALIFPRPRGTAVVELNRSSSDLNAPLELCRVETAHLKVGPAHRGCSIIV